MDQGRRTTTAALTAGLLTLAVAGTAAAWGEAGHDMIGRVAAEGLPSSMPSFFTGAVDQLAYLNPEPDRWRERDLREMDEAYKYDHYIDLENVSPGALESPDRFRFLAALYAAGIERPEQAVGFLPYRILELHQRLVTGFARWRVVETEEERRWIEERVVNDAGILGHYVADAANPHHSTIHFNGWSRDAPNPRGFTTSDDFHWRFESAFVNAHVTIEDVRRAVTSGVEPMDDVHGSVRTFIQGSNDLVVRLYELEQVHGFDPDAAAPDATRRFAIDRLAAGTQMLRSLWYAAWVESEALAAAWTADGDG
jgi:hypothetical protein